MGRKGYSHGVLLVKYARLGGCKKYPAAGDWALRCPRAYRWVDHLAECRVGKECQSPPFYSFPAVIPLSPQSIDLEGRSTRAHGGE